MSATIFIYLLPYILSFAISSAVALYSWRHREVPGGQHFAVMVSLQAAMTFGFIFELLTPSLEGKIFWDDIQWLFTCFLPFFFFLFAFHYSQQDLVWSRRVIVSFAIVPAVFFLLVLTNSQHHLARASGQLVPGLVVDELYYAFTPTVIIYTIYVYIITLIGIYFLTRRFFHAPRLYRYQVLMVIIGILIPFAGSLISLLEIPILFHRDLFPITSAIGNLVVAFGLYRFRLLDIVPAARDRVIENLGGAVIVIDAYERVIDMNPAACRSLGVLPDAAIGRPWRDLLKGWPDYLDEYDGETDLHTEMRLEVQGEMRDLDVLVTPLVDRRGARSGWVVLVNDITVQKTIERELIRHRDRLETFAYTVSHDLKAPLRGIDGYSYLLMENYFDQLDNDGRFYIANIRQGIRRMDKLIEDLLTYSRLQRQELALDDVDLPAVVEQILIENREAIAGCGAEVRSMIAVDSLRAEIDGLHMALRNLLENALEFSADSAPPKIEIGAKVVGDACRIWVRDNGIGFEMTYHDRIFELFQRLHTEDAYPGTGVGLALTAMAMERVGGRAWAVGKPGEGATFYLEIPL